MLHAWDSFIVEGNQLFDFMSKNFQDMFKNNKIKHFDIRDGFYGYIYDTDELKEKYNPDIQVELINWIQNELKSGHLFEKDNWKPFRDASHMSEMYHGYRKLFKYQQYYFQFIMESECTNDKCSDDIEGEHYFPHFALALYGWVDNNSNKLLPYQQESILSDDIMPETDWIYQ